MKASTCIPLVAILLFLAPLATSSGSLSSGSRSVPEDDLYEHMMELKSGLKTLAMNLRSGELEPCLAAVTEMQRHTLASKRLMPPNLDEVPEARHAEHEKAFRGELARLLSELALLEIELLEGKTEAANERVRGKLFELRESAHERFQQSE